jgi:hypothetical protein
VWEIIRSDLMAALEAFWHRDTRDIHSINGALMILLSKSPEAQMIREYKLISLIHVVGKLI